MPVHAILGLRAWTDHPSRRADSQGRMDLKAPLQEKVKEPLSEFAGFPDGNLQEATPTRDMPGCSAKSGLGDTGS